MKSCPNCGASLSEVIGGYLCNECSGGMYSEDEVITPRCPSCGNELESYVDDEFYCYDCGRPVSRGEAIISGNSDFSDDYGYDEPDYNSMINNGEGICLNCTYWSVSPYGASHGMVCRRGYSTSGPEDSCSDFVQSHSFANYGDSGQYQFDETSRDISNKLYHWKNNR